MSTSNSATIESIGIVGWSVKYSEPSSPASSAVCDTSRIERRGFTFPFMNASAISISAIVPLPSSSAPLLIESGRGAWILRRLSRIARIAVVSSADGWCGRLSAPSGRMIALNARRESWSTTRCEKPMWSLWAVIATYSPRSAGSVPGMMPTTFLANPRRIVVSRGAIPGTTWK